MENHCVVKGLLLSMLDRQGVDTAAVEAVLIALHVTGLCRH